MKESASVRKVTLSYCLGQTTITISGTVTAHYDNKGDPKNFDRTAFVSTGVGADTSKWYEVALKRKRPFRGDNEIDLRLAPDGRLLGAGSQASGGGADVAAGVVAVLTLAATAASAAVALTEAPSPTHEHEQDQAPGIERRGDGSAWGDLNDRAEEARILAWKLQGRALDLARHAAGDPPPAGLADQIKTVSVSLDLARAELANLRQALKAWQSKHYPDRSATFTYHVGLDDLDDLDTVDRPPDYLQKKPSELKEGVRGAACTLHTIVLRAGHPEPVNPAEPVKTPPITDHEIRYRVPYPARLAIYELWEKANVEPANVMDQALTWRLRQVVPIWALGKESEERTLDVVTTVFGRSSLQVDFGDSGAVSHISVADVGPIANLSNTISGAVQASGSGSGSPAPAASAAAPPAAAPAGPGAWQDPVLAPLQIEAAVKKVQADIAGYDKAIRDNQADAQPPKQGDSNAQPPKQGGSEEQ